jgi:peptidoglycan hydrolase CwlO-like protein
VKMNIWIIGIVLLVIVVFLFRLINNKNEKMIVIMKDKADNEFAVKGLEEFSTNFDVEWLDVFQKNLNENNVNFSEADFNKIKSVCDKVKGNNKEIEKMESDIEVNGQAYHVNIVVEWDDFMGYLLRIYSDKKEVITTIEDIWVKTTEELGV